MTKKKTSDKRKIALAVLAGLAVTGLIGASAASLGGISNEGLGAAADDVASCDDTGVTVSYDTSYAGSSTVGVNTVTVGQVNLLCDLLSYEVQLIDGSDAVIIEKTGTILLTPETDPADLLGLENFEFSVDLSGDGVDAEAVEGIAITITGNEFEDV